MRRLRVLLDANVIVDAQVRDLFCNLADAEIVELRWSEMILDETRKALNSKIGIDKIRLNRLFSALERAFPGAQVVGYERLIAGLDLPDAGDCHVLAAAIHGECDFLVTYNVSDFVGAVHDGLSVVSVDEALLYFADRYPNELLRVVNTQINMLATPPMSPKAFLDRLVKVAKLTATRIGAILEIESYLTMHSHLLVAISDESPVAAVKEMLDACRIGDSKTLSRLVDPQLANIMCERVSATPEEILTKFRACLKDVFASDDWGFGTSPRVLEPGVELVKLIR